MSSDLAKVALVTCDAYPRLYEDDLLVASALEELGVLVVPVIWSDTSVDWTSFDAVVIRSPWDYSPASTILLMRRPRRRRRRRQRGSVAAVSSWITQAWPSFRVRSPSRPTAEGCCRRPD